MWEIIDNNGIIHSGSEEEMRKAFFVMCNHDIELIKDQFNIKRKVDALSLIKEYPSDWDGDLKLIQIHEIYK